MDTMAGIYVGELVVIETGVVVGYIAAWLMGKAKRVGRQVDADMDSALDKAVAKLHDLVTKKLGDDAALSALEEEAAGDGEVRDRTRTRVELSLEDAVERDEEFAAALSALLNDVRRADVGTGVTVGHDGVAVGRDINIRAENGGIAGWSIGTVHAPPPVDPS
jgi:hypothetical protein